MKQYLLWILVLLWAGLILYLTTIPNFSPSPDTIISWMLSNGGHFFFFGVLAALLKISVSHQPSTINHWPLALTSFYGLVIEFIQRTIPGRSFDLVDWTLDTLGAIAFLFILKKLQSRS